MKKRVRITETLTRIVEVEADTDYEAEQRACREWKLGKWVLTADDFVHVNTTCLGDTIDEG